MNKVVKGLGVLAGVITIINSVIAIINVKKAQELRKNYTTAVTYGDQKIDMSTKDKTTDVGVMFAAAELDYTKCEKLDEPYELKLFNRFSGVEIVVPEEWHVKLKGKIAFAGIENYTATYDDQEASLILNFDTKFAGVSVKNHSYSTE